MSHTPGPLSAKMCPARTVAIAEGDRGTLWMVAYQTDTHEGEIAITQGVSAEGNAKLFAAAPDLLAALILCKASLRYFPGHSNREGDAEIDAAYSAAEAAIAKATGVTNA